MIRIAYIVVLCFAVIVSACKNNQASGSSDSAVPADSATAAPSASVPPAPPSPLDQFHAYQETMTAEAEAGRYGNVCKGSPWFPASICHWVADRADGKAVGRPNSELYRNLFYAEHWKHAFGTIVGDAGGQGDYEASVSGYRNHILLDTVDTKYESNGRFNMWVQEEPDTREVTLKSGTTANWVVLAEMPLAKALMDLAHSGVSVESTAIAKDAMKVIAEYTPYSVLKGTIPPLPGAAPTAATPAPGLPSVAPSGAAPAPSAVGASPGLAACCNALEQAAPFAGLVAVCRMNLPVPAATRKDQLRQAGAAQGLPPLPSACR